MDRTRDFRSFAEIITAPKRSTSYYKAHRQAAIRGFAEVTKRVAGDIALSAMKLEKLEILCYEKSNQSETEIEELIYIVKQDISALNRALTRLKQLSEQNITRTSLNQYWAHTDSVATTLQRKLGGVSEPFRDLLEARKKKLQSQKSTDNYDGYGQTGPAMEMRSRNPHGHNNASTGGEAVVVDMYMDMEMEKRRARDKQTSAIESSLSQLEGIFTQLAGLVHEQGEQIQRIDDDISMTAYNVEGAHSEITKYFQSISSNRSLILKTFATLIAVFTLFILFRG